MGGITQVFADPTFKGKGSGGYYDAPFKFPDVFHLAALLWDTDDTVAWFVDGKKRLSVKYNWVLGNGKPAPYAHVLLNLSVGGQWAGRYGIEEKLFPQAFEVDYVRVYQKKGQILTGEGRIGQDLLYRDEKSAAPVAATATTAAAPCPPAIGGPARKKSGSRAASTDAGTRTLNRQHRTVNVEGETGRSARFS